MIINSFIEIHSTPGHFFSASDYKRQTIRKAGYRIMKKIWCILLALILLLLAGCSLQRENAGDESSAVSEQETSGSAEDALIFIEKAAAEHDPPEEGATRSYVRKKATVKSEDTVCYVYKIVDDYGSYKKALATYAASIDGSIVLRYDIVTDEYVPLSGK